MKKLATLVGIASLGLGAATLAADGTQPFAQDLWKQLGRGSENVIYSPFSIAQALDLARKGAKGATKDEIDVLLHGDLAKLEGKDVSVANHIWAQSGLAMKKTGDSIDRIDFRKADEARTTINAQIAKETRERIQDLIPSGAISPATKLVLTNAVYLNAKWQHPFEKNNTWDAPFTLADGSKVDVSTMHATFRGGAKYGAKDGLEVVELPYEGSLVFDVILPADMKKYSLDLEGALALLEAKPVGVALPRFEVTQPLELNDALVALGVKTAFTDAADFSGFTDEAALQISRVITKTFVRVDEVGTEAAAATAVVMVGGAAPSEEEVPSMNVDRPFFFAIRDAKTGVVAFFGRVAKPAAPQRAK